MTEDIEFKKTPEVIDHLLKAFVGINKLTALSPRIKDVDAFTDYFHAHKEPYLIYHEIKDYYNCFLTYEFDKAVNTVIITVPDVNLDLKLTMNNERLAFQYNNIQHLINNVNTQLFNLGVFFHYNTKDGFIDFKRGEDFTLTRLHANYKSASDFVNSNNVAVFERIMNQSEVFFMNLQQSIRVLEKLGSNVAFVLEIENNGVGGKRTAEHQKIINRLNSRLVRYVLLSAVYLKQMLNDFGSLYFVKQCEQGINVLTSVVSKLANEKLANKKTASSLSYKSLDALINEYLEFYGLIKVCKCDPQ